MMNSAWGDICFLCGAEADDNSYGLVGPLSRVKEQKKICLGCLEHMKKFRHRT